MARQTTEDKIAQEIEAVEALRARLAENRDGQVKTEAEQVQELHLAQLQAERARLEAQVAEQERINSRATLENNSTLAAAREAMAHASAQLKGEAEIAKVEGAVQAEVEKAEADAKAAAEKAAAEAAAAAKKAADEAAARAAEGK